MKIAFIGLGSMGAPLARLIARAGHELGVYDSHAPAGEAFRDITAVAGSPADAARGAEVVCVCVRDDRQVEDVVFGLSADPLGARGLDDPGDLVVQVTLQVPGRELEGVAGDMG
ncbi:MAG TPA: NAD(P)-binding domain-containing protein, partial [Pseudomonadales bacterium]|nr:NAD(P)-binding domain-containing protein [Pseudomonadales bacterium]